MVRLVNSPVSSPGGGGGGDDPHRVTSPGPTSPQTPSSLARTASAGDVLDATEAAGMPQSSPSGSAAGAFVGSGRPLARADTVNAQFDGFALSLLERCQKAHAVRTQCGQIPEPGRHPNPVNYSLVIAVAHTTQTTTTQS